MEEQESMLKLWHNKRAITPVLSNVLLLVIAVAGMSISITATYVITGNLHETMGERMIIEDVWFTSDGISVYLLNTGKTRLSIEGVYVDYMQQIFTSLELEPLQHGWTNMTFTWTADTVYYLKIVTSRGTQLADHYKSP
jgi:E3 ubiquitin-protein ligase DOA10